MAKDTGETKMDAYSKLFLMGTPKRASKVLDHLEKAKGELMELGKESILAGRAYQEGKKAPEKRSKEKKDGEKKKKEPKPKVDTAAQNEALSVMQEAQSDNKKGRGKKALVAHPKSVDDLSSFFGVPSPKKAKGRARITIEAPGVH